MGAKIKELSIKKAREKPKKAPIVLMEDNLTKAKKALMAPKQLCPRGLNIQTIEKKVNLGEQDVDKLTTLREALIKKSRDCCTQGQTWCANIYYHAVDYRVDTIAAENVKFTIYGAI